MNKYKECEEEFNKGAAISLTINRCLSFVEIEKEYHVHRSTVLNWSKHYMYDVEHGYKRLLYEYLKRYNSTNTKIFMNKYNLPKNNTLAHISEAFLIDLDTIDKMQVSRKQWSLNLLQTLTNTNIDLFSMQIKLIKQMIQQSTETFKGYQHDNV